MKKNLYVISTAILLSLLLLNSCGGKEQQVNTSISKTSSVVTEMTQSVQEETDVTVSEVKVCTWRGGQVTVMEQDGSAVSIPYDENTHQIRLADGSAGPRMNDLWIGDQLVIYRKAGEIIRVEILERGEDVRLHGIVCRVGETLWVHPRPQEVLDPAKVDPADCYEIPLRGVPVGNRLPPDPTMSAEDLKVGDFVTVYHSEQMVSSNQPDEVYSVIRCGNVVEQMTVSRVNEEMGQIWLDDVELSVGNHENGLILDGSGKALSLADISVGDIFEVQHGGEILTSAPSQFGHLHVVRRIKTAAQIEADRAAQDALDALTRKVVLRGTVREFGTSKLVWLGETAAPEEIQYHGCTRVRMYDVPITDAATGQALTWADLRDGDYVAVEGSGGIAETAPSQWDTIYSVTRLNRLCLEGTVSAVTPEGVTVAFEDGKSRTVSVKQYYVRSVRFDVSSLLVGDRVRLDVNAADEAEVYALHLIDRESVVPEGAVVETFRVVYSHGREIIVEGDISFTTKQIFYDIDGSVRARNNLRSGDMLTIAHDGNVTGGDPYLFGTIYRIDRVSK